MNVRGLAGNSRALYPGRFINRFLRFRKGKGRFDYEKLLKMDGRFRDGTQDRFDELLGL